MKPEHCCARRVTILIEWIIDEGIGEQRAILVENGQIIEARISRHDGIKPGLVTGARLITKLVAGTRGIVLLQDGAEALLSPVPKGLNEGESLVVEVVRTAIDEKSRFKLPQVKVAPEKTHQPALSFLDEILAGSLPHNFYRPHDATDALEANGWSEVLEEARTGQIAFDGGNLLIALTPAMTFIDIDGDMAPVPLAMVAAEAAAKAIRRLDIQGNIGIDFPTLTDKADRQKVADAFDAAMHGPFERTAINGFGFMQVVTRRSRQSLPELLQYRAVTAHTLELLRRAQREHKAGGMRIVAHPAIIAKLQKRSDWTEALGGSTGRTISLRGDPKLAMNGGYVEAAG